MTPFEGGNDGNMSRASGIIAPGMPSAITNQCCEIFAWYWRVFYGIAWYYRIVLICIVWNLMLLAWHRNSRIEWYQIAEYGIAWSLGQK